MYYSLVIFVLSRQTALQFHHGFLLCICWIWAIFEFNRIAKYSRQLPFSKIMYTFIYMRLNKKCGLQVSAHNGCGYYYFTLLMLKYLWWLVRFIYCHLLNKPQRYQYIISNAPEVFKAFCSVCFSCIISCSMNTRL